MIAAIVKTMCLIQQASFVVNKLTNHNAITKDHQIPGKNEWTSPGNDHQYEVSDEYRVDIGM